MERGSEEMKRIVGGERGSGVKEWREGVKEWREGVKEWREGVKRVSEESEWREGVKILELRVIR